MPIVDLILIDYPDKVALVGVVLVEGIRQPFMVGPVMTMGDKICQEALEEVAAGLYAQVPGVWEDARTALLELSLLHIRNSCRGRNIGGQPYPCPVDAEVMPVPMLH